MRLEFKKGATGQYVEFYASLAFDSTPSISTVDKNNTTITSSTTSYTTVDGVSTTIDVAADEGDTTFKLASTSDIAIGRFYFVENSKGQKEQVRVIAIDDGDSVTVDKRLSNDYDTSSTFKSFRFTYTLQTEDLNQLRDSVSVIATFTNNSKQYEKRKLYDCVLHVLENPLTIETLLNYSPDITLQEWSEQNGESFERQRRAAWEKVCRDIRRQGKRPSLIIDNNDLIDWSLAELSLMLQSSGVSILRDIEQSEALDRLTARRDKEKLDAMQSLSWYDEIEDGSLDEDKEARPLRMDFVR